MAKKHLPIEFFSVNGPFHIVGTMMHQKNAMKLNPGGGAK